MSGVIYTDSRRAFIYTVRKKDHWLRIGDMVIVILQQKPLKVKFHYDNNDAGPFVELRGHTLGPVGKSGSSKATSLQQEEVFSLGNIEGKRIHSPKGNVRILFTGPPGFYVESDRYSFLPTRGVYLK